MAFLVDELLGKHWSRFEGEFIGSSRNPSTPDGDRSYLRLRFTGIPMQKVEIDGQEVTLIGLPLIFQQFQEDGKQPSDATKQELLETVKSL